MGSGNLEVFKFATYLFIPVFAMLHYGDPKWFEKNVKPYKDIFWPPYEETYKPPRTASELQEELARFRAEKLGQAATKPSTISDPSPSTSAQPTDGESSGTAKRFEWAAGERRLV